MCCKIILISDSGECNDKTEKMDDQEIDPDIMNMVAAMCGDYSGLTSVEPDKR